MVMKDLLRLSEARRKVFVEAERMFYWRDAYMGASAFQFKLTQLTEISWEMAKKIAEAKGKTPKKKSEFKGFANIELDLEQKAEMKEWIRDPENFMVELDEMAASGYKMGYQKSEATGGYQATAFCQDPESPNAGYILSAFAPHWYDALACVAYKHAIVCEGVWPLKDEQRGDMWG